MKKLIAIVGLASLFTAGLALAAPREASAQEFYGQASGQFGYEGTWGNDHGRRGHGRDNRNHHRPSFQTQVTESYYEAVATFSWQWDWGCQKWVQVQTGTTWVLRSQSRVVNVFWYAAWNTYVYYNRSGQLTVFVR